MRLLGSGIEGGVGLAALLLADGRFPAGGHVHSAGVEAAVADGRVHDLASLDAFVTGRLWTVGLTEASLAAATATRLGGSPDPDDDGHEAVVEELDAEAHARLPVPALRDASRRQGRQLVRVAARCWPRGVLTRALARWPGGLHLPVAWGVVAVAAGLGPGDVAQLCLHHAVTTPAQAAVRLLGLDPFAVAALTARLASTARTVAHEAMDVATGPLDELPARSGVLVDVAAHEHAGWDSRLFAT
jgi:urease accessory protein